MLDINLLRKDLGSVIARLETRKSPQTYLDVANESNVDGLMRDATDSSSGCKKGAMEVPRCLVILFTKHKVAKHSKPIARETGSVLMPGALEDSASAANAM